ncbi:unnamed protein product [Linum tenue]|uniref:W2 domain-containing protein n=1 Tax=Linum tenue TaxID=586396 RepID=A0AAV0IFL7_9ROSI|nr:unnamed protein product [Linum tenue]
MKKHQVNTLDPGAFSESFMRVLNESGGDFAVLSKSLERSDLELSKYGDRFFEVVFLGSSAQSRSLVPVEGGGKNLYAIFTGDSTEVVFLGSSAQSRSLVPVEGGGRNLYAIFTGDSTEVPSSSLNWNHGARLGRGPKENYLEEGNDQIVLYLERQQKEADLEELEANFSEFLGDLDLKAPTTIAKEISGIIAKSRVPVIEAAGLLWEAIVKTVKWPGSGTNQKDNEMVAISHLSRCGDVIFEKFCSGNIACQMQLINSVQRTCWREPKMLNLFARVIRVLYDVDVLCEDVILNWFYKGTNADGRETFLEDLKPFIRWLEEAEEEEAQKADLTSTVAGRDIYLCRRTCGCTVYWCDVAQSLGLSDDDLLKVLKKFSEVMILEKVWAIKGKSLRNVLLRNPKVLGYNVDCKGDCIAQCTRC